MEIDPERWYWPSTPVWCEGPDDAEGGHMTTAGETPVVREMGYVYCSTCADQLPEDDGVTVDDIAEARRREALGELDNFDPELEDAQSPEAEGGFDRD